MHLRSILCCISWPPSDMHCISRLVSRQLPSLTTRNLHLSAMAPVAVGDKVPSVTLFENSPANKVDLAELCAGKKVLLTFIIGKYQRCVGQVVIFGVPGAFTPGCSKTHLPGYVEAAADLKGKGINEIVCVSVNDPFVMEAWGKDQAADGKVRLMSAIYYN